MSRENRSGRLRTVFVCAIGGLASGFACVEPAHAYIDPGTGGLFAQLLLGGVAGALVIAKLYWAKITGPFRRGKKTQGDA